MARPQEAFSIGNVGHIKMNHLILNQLTPKHTMNTMNTMNTNMHSKLYKLVVNNRIIAEGNRKDMQKLLKLRSDPKGTAFIGMGSPFSELGRQWNNAQ